MAQVAQFIMSGCSLLVKTSSVLQAIAEKRLGWEVSRYRYLTGNLHMSAPGETIIVVDFRASVPSLSSSSLDFLLFFPITPPSPFSPLPFPFSLSYISHPPSSFPSSCSSISVFHILLFAALALPPASTPPCLLSHISPASPSRPQPLFPSCLDAAHCKATQASSIFHLLCARGVEEVIRMISVGR